MVVERHNTENKKYNVYFLWRDLSYVILNSTDMCKSWDNKVIKTF